MSLGIQVFSTKTGQVCMSIASSQKPPSWSCAEHKPAEAVKASLLENRVVRAWEKTHAPEIAKVYLDCERVQSNLNCKMFREQAAGDKDLSFSLCVLHGAW